MKFKAYAKINLTLDVTGRREDGYHNLCMIMQSVSLADTVELAKNAGGITLDMGESALPCDERNVAYAAAQLFYKKAEIQPEISIKIEKNIPEAAGLGGGSADAAAVLYGLNEMYGRPFDITALSEIALSLGADVPFCLTGGTALAEGIGEKLTALNPMPDCGILLVKPGEKPSTGEMYRAIDSADLPPHPDNGGMLAGVESGSLTDVCRCLGNSFDAVWRNDDLHVAKERIRSTGAMGVSLSGSGPTLFGIFPTLKSAQEAHETVKPDYPVSFAVSPVNCGVKIF